MLVPRSVKGISCLSTGFTMKTAFFLGAGASKTFGYPLTSEILPFILWRLNEGKLFNSFGNKTDPHQMDRERFRLLLSRVVPG
jgi:hypothetical protein